MQKIITYLWYNDKAEEAARFYVSIFKDSRIVDIVSYDVPGQDRPTKVVTFQLEGQEFIALDGNPEFKFTLAISLLVNCETQAEVDHLWDKLLEGGEPDACGWLRDKYGVSWQIVPTVLDKLMQDKDPEKASRVMKAMLQMVKLDIAELQRAYDGA